MKKTNKFEKAILYDGHTSSLSPILGRFNSYEEAALAAENIVMEELNKIQKQLNIK